MKNELLEALSDLEHQQWAEWTDYYFKTQITQEKIDRWTKQINTPYWQLSENEKESDRKFARKVIELVTKEILKHRDCKVMHDVEGEDCAFTCLDMVLESLGYVKTNESVGGKNGN